MRGTRPPFDPSSGVPAYVCSLVRLVQASIITQFVTNAVCPKELRDLVKTNFYHNRRRQLNEKILENSSFYVKKNPVFLTANANVLLQYRIGCMHTAHRRQLHGFSIVPIDSSPVLRSACERLCRARICH